jgi:hypothetical protein
MAIRQLQTPDQVVDVIGRDRVMAITQKRTNNVTNWLSSGHFPPETFFVMDLELRKKRCRAPLKLWRMIEPLREARAA